MRAVVAISLSIASSCGLWLTANASAQDRSVLPGTLVYAVGDNTLLPPTEQVPGVVDIKYEQGELKISAQNAPFGDVLRAVCNRLGVALEFNDEIEQRIFAAEGPGPVREVFSRLLGSMPVNYVMLGTAEDPAALAKVIIMNRRSATPAAVGTKPSASTARRPQVQADIQTHSIAVPQQPSNATVTNAPANAIADAPVSAPSQKARTRGRRRTVKMTSTVGPDSGGADSPIE